MKKIIINTLFIVLVCVMISCNTKEPRYEVGDMVKLYNSENKCVIINVFIPDFESDSIIYTIRLVNPPPYFDGKTRVYPSCIERRINN